ncbi:hypothetical protein [Arcobacter cloacae]|uniref:Uncharacterized protein n=1 Tax=Arcobacter cloacae TaxID=1054034 RepID=A0A6M8NG88_9BACT|nr:hypothetical protein [Arcobacter cloacae]QKF88631.1 hypothetical protein ACLO_0086 [Arcobacter cloacae]RXI41593.1 hypothetical protein CP963_05665 [Arcobacter cloacae]
MKLLLILIFLVSFSLSTDLKNMPFESPKHTKVNIDDIIKSLPTDIDTLILSSYQNTKQSIDNIIKCLSEPTPQEKEWIKNVRDRGDYLSMQKPLYIQAELWENFNEMSQGYEILIDHTENNRIKERRYVLIKLIQLYYESSTSLKNSYDWEKYIVNCNNKELYIFYLRGAGSILLSNLESELINDLKK